MELIICGEVEAHDYKPLKPTLAFRIFLPSVLGNYLREKPLEGENYVGQYKYYFDDIWPGSWGINKDSVMFDETLASQMLDDFEKHKSNIETFLIHCGRGINRSPAVAIAFNDIYKLGYDSKKLEEKYSEANWYVCNLLNRFAKTKVVSTQRLDKN